MKKVLKVIGLNVLLLFQFNGLANSSPSNTASDPLLALNTGDYVGSSTCLACHSDYYNSWQGSDHQKAMQLSSKDSVLGDFNNRTFNYAGIETSFFQRDGHYWVKTDSPTGELKEYRVSYTFGHYPLQQYLVNFPDGRLQALSIAWDSREAEEGGQRWFHLYPGEEIDHSDALHWSGTHHTWNSRCADCHSTGLEKNYDDETDSYDTRYQEISVGCESCHGAGKEHVNWAKLPDDKKKDKTPDRYKSENIDQIPQCGRCHSRRVSINETDSNAVESHQKSLNGLDAFLQDYELRVLDESLYHPDGQIQDEVFVLGSFLQSKMYQAGVQCTQCHNPHSLKLQKPGNSLCAQCHQEEAYNKPSHHRHAMDSEGAQCVNCHMPETVYMSVDPRRDHSFTIPRPDHSKELGTPNACAQCHQEKPESWLVENYNAWYPRGDKSDHKGKTIFNARIGRSGAFPDLLSMIDDENHAAIFRATALKLLDRYPSQEAVSIAIKHLSSADALVRSEAVQVLEMLPPQHRVTPLLGLLKDPVKKVRLDATLALIPAKQWIPAADQQLLSQSIEKLLDTRKQNNDTPSGLLQLGVLYERLGRLNEALDAYDRVETISNKFLPALVNKADVLRRLDRKQDSFRELIKALELQPKNAEVNHGLGLWHIREKQLVQALPYLKTAWESQPENPRLVYVYAVALFETGSASKAIEALEDGVKQHPNNEQLKSALRAYQLRLEK